MFRLECASQEYAWGKTGDSSMVARLKKAADATFQVQPDEHYAELWMGTHVNGPSNVVTDEKTEPLLDFLDQGSLPYLFKVLSVETALSIQAHPDRQRAERLHCEFPDKYKDPNHKPELAIALTEFKALCQFRPTNEIVENLQQVKEFFDLLSTTTVIQDYIQDPTAGNLRKFFTAWISAEPNAVKTALNRLEKRLEMNTAVHTDTDQIVQSLLRQYPNDIGVLAPYLLNCVTLQPGEALYLGPNEPHAYLSGMTFDPTSDVEEANSNIGDCLECMAASDNVVRAGLTSKFIDRATLCDMLTYRCGPPQYLHPTPLRDCTVVFSPPIEDFAIERMVIPDQVSVSGAADGPAILLVLCGKGSASCDSKTFELSCGSVLLQQPNVTIELSCKGDKDLVVYRARSNFK